MGAGHEPTLGGLTRYQYYVLAAAWLGWGAFHADESSNRFGFSLTIACKALTSLTAFCSTMWPRSFWLIYLV